ncbi:type IIL restriction-modification enzyme MmeI [Chamaesiphon sp. VAR_69_metabat_338]|uniref:type IIL restriction-modification enzyme MmeI n=1 Tax=Chamaesiphon sp. VAR_69_metabat_338 TaxID=2964704 RepID=UPI00286DBDA0|nr:type IIL restriction-modification enzyme MmeI [Chamaesiphon sp. VAR_69_metabat_338]
MTVVSSEEKPGILLEATDERETDDVKHEIKFKYTIGKINSDLTVGTDLNDLIRLIANRGLACPGVQLSGQGFVLSPEEVNLFSKKTRKELIRSYLTGRDLTQVKRIQFVIDTLALSQEHLRDEYPDAYQWIMERVKPERDQSSQIEYAKNWWLHSKPRPKFRETFTNLRKFIATSRTARHRVFQFLPSDTLPETKVLILSSDDAMFLGVISSQIHVIFANAVGGWLGVGNDSTYNHSRCFDCFPFPDPTPEQKQKIRELGDRLDSHRKQVQAAHPDITITGMYNLLEKLRAGEPFTDIDRAYNNRALVSTLKQIHDDLDTAVFAAYGWQDLAGKHHPEITETILERLVALNAERAAEERNGHIRWLRPEYQAPEQVQATQTTLAGIDDPAETAATPVEQQKWSNQPKDQLAAVRDLLRSSSGAWTVVQIANQFTGKNTQKKLEAIGENLDRLEWFGLLVKRDESGITYWQYAELQQTA